MVFLIVDDDDLICQNVYSKVNRIFPNQNHRILTANNAFTALKIFEEEKPDLVITDINMPGKSGLVLIEEIRKQDKDVMIFVLSGYDDFEIVRKAFMFKINDYLLKPVSLTELNEKLNIHFHVKNDGANINPSLMEKAVQYIEDNLTLNLSLHDVAEYVSLSYNYFSKMFKDHFGENFPSYILRLRMEKAKLYLDDPTFKIKDVSAKLGYKNQHLFSRAFHKYTGQYPMEYKRSKGLPED